jgi:hypothetical protein
LLQVISFPQDSLGISWQRCFGGFKNEMHQFDLSSTGDFLYLTEVNTTNVARTIRKPDMAVSSDGSVLMITSTYSKDGDLKGLRRYADSTSNTIADIFVVRLDSNGRMLWKKCLGGSKNDLGGAALALPDGYLISGTTESNDGDFSNFGIQALPFVIKLDLNGNIVWNKLFFSNLSNGVKLYKSRSNKKIAERILLAFDKQGC